MKTSKKIITVITNVDAIIKKLKEIKDDPQLHNLLYNTDAGYTLTDIGNNLRKFQIEIKNTLIETMMEEIRQESDQ